MHLKSQGHSRPQAVLLPRFFLKFCIMALVLHDHPNAASSLNCLTSQIILSICRGLGLRFTIVLSFSLPASLGLLAGIHISTKK